MSEKLHQNICEEQLFASLYKKYAKDLHDFLYYKYGETFDPQDKVQEAFIKLWKNCKAITLKKTKSYLFTVANNMTLNSIKHHKVVLKFQQHKPKNYTHETPEYLMEESQYLEKFQKALSNLSESKRVAFLLNRVEGKKHQEIADQLGVPRKTIEKRIYSALSELRVTLEEL